VKNARLCGIVINAASAETVPLAKLKSIRHALRRIIEFIARFISTRVTLVAQEEEKEMIAARE